MTRPILRALNVISVSLLVAVGLNACTDSEQQAAIDRQKRVEQQEAQEQAQKAAATPEQTPTQDSGSQSAATSPEPVQTPEAPAEPEKVDNYKISGMVCGCHEQKECGSGFWRCTNGKIHECMHDVSYETVSVEKTEANDGNCN